MESARAKTVPPALAALMLLLLSPCCCAHSTTPLRWPVICIIIHSASPELMHVHLDNPTKATGKTANCSAMGLSCILLSGYKGRAE